jgi:preprotein translocase subunit Sec61beta
MAGLYTPQSQAGIMNFYDAQTSGPKINPKIMLAVVILFIAIVLVIDHVAFA